MPTPDADSVWARLAGYAAALRAQGAIRSEAVERAFATVRRDRCLTSFHSPDGMVDVPQDTVPPAEVLDRIYRDQALITHLDERGAPASSTSQPALVAEMLEALELTPSARVLEIGAGTGYNAALLATITKAPVVTVEAAEPVAAEAHATLRRLGLHRLVTVVHGDGYHGWPAGAPYDRIIMTCGCAGLSPRWLAQLAPGGLALVPVAHGGVHPILAVWRDGSALRGRMTMWADFMQAAGPLGHRQPAMLDAIPAGAEFVTHARLGPWWIGAATPGCGAFLPPATPASPASTRWSRASIRAGACAPCTTQCAASPGSRWTAASMSPVCRRCWRRPAACCANGRPWADRASRTGAAPSPRVDRPRRRSSPRATGRS
jgi:protein-L-isoaspartate(D-aspartate) O-methyltransferase